MKNIDLEKLVWMEIGEELEIKTNGKIYRLNKKNIDKDIYLVFGEKDKEQTVKMNVDRAEKIINYTRMMQERFLDEIDFFFEDIYNAYNIELNLV